MGNCGGRVGMYDTDEETSDDELDLQEARVVMMGASFAGKSTLLAQMRCLYKNGFSQQQREEHAPIVHAVVMDAALSLVDHLKHEAGPGLVDWETVYGAKSAAAKVHLASFEAAREACSEAERTHRTWTVEQAAHFQALWGERCVKDAFKQHWDGHHVFGSAAYFFARVSQLAQDDWVPTEDECVRTSDPAARGKGYTAALMLSPVGKATPSRALDFPVEDPPAIGDADDAGGDDAAAAASAAEGGGEDGDDAGGCENSKEAEAAPATAVAATPERSRPNIRTARSGEFLRRGSWGGQVPGLAMVLGNREGGKTKVRVTEVETPTCGTAAFEDPTWVTDALPGDGSVAALIYVVDVGAFSSTTGDGVSSVQHALDAFDKIMEHADLGGVTIFVWLNKRDLFERQYIQSSFPRFFKRYHPKSHGASTPHGTMKGNPNEALEFLRNEFVFTSGRSKDSELMHTYTVSAFNRDQVKAVVNSAARYINA